MPRREDDVAPRPVPARRRTVIQACGFLLAAAATLVVLVTDNPQLLKVAVVAVAWAFVIATFAAGRRGTDRLAAAVRERELRRNYEQELEREVAARHEYELELENELRRETEDAMRHELDALRGEIAALSGLQDEVARVSALREDIAALTSLRDEVARVAALHDDVVALNSLRQELGELAELRSDMGRLRAELTEQLSSEMLVERIVMRTQASRLMPEAPRLDAAPAWTDDVPPRELTGGWPAVRLDEPRETQQFEQVRVERTDPRQPAAAHHPAAAAPVPSWEPPTAEPAWDAPLASTWETPADGARSGAPVPPPTTTFAVVGPPPSLGPQQDRWSAPSDPEESPRSRHSTGVSEPDAAPRTQARQVRPVPYRRETPAAPATALTPISAPPLTPAEPPPSPLEWLAARALIEQPPPAARPEQPTALRPEAPPPAVLRPEVPPRGRRPDVEQPSGASAPAATTQNPVAPQPPPSRSEPTTQGTRVAEILAENGVTPPSGGRRRRRYRDDDEPDDVLARVLGRD